MARSCTTTASGSLAFVSRVLAPVSSSRALVLVRSPGSVCPGLLAHLSWPPLAACHYGAPGARPWRSLSHSICFSLCPRSFSFFGALCRVFCGTMSRGDDLRRLAAQLTALAELEDSVAVGISRVLGSAGTAAGSHAASAAATASPVASSTSLRELSSHEAGAALPRAAATTAASSRARTRSRSLVPLPKRAPRRSSSTVSVARGSVALGESGLVTGLAVKSCPPVPAAQLRLSRVSLARLLQLRALRGLLAKLLRLLHQRKPLRLPANQMSRPTLTAIGMPSSTHTASLRLPMSLQPPSPSRPMPPELVGALATSAAVACAKPPSALCGAISERPRCVSHATWPALVQSLLCTPP